ncbi:MAG: hypothetical protein NZ839_04380, partial [Endomicrobia bacterium]|nr:hypothetical protein [Endomicrobiia bacterium]
YKIIKLQSEIYNLTRDTHNEHKNIFGGYLFLNYKFSKYYSLGTRFDFVEELNHQHNHNSEDHHKQQMSTNVLLTRNLTETTYLRLQYKYDMKNSEHIGYIQTVFGFGPHSHMLE